MSDTAVANELYDLTLEGISPEARAIVVKRFLVAVTTVLHDVDNIVLRTKTAEIIGRVITGTGKYQNGHPGWNGRSGSRTNDHGIGT